MAAHEAAFFLPAMTIAILPNLGPKPCIGCEIKLRSTETTDGAFCSRECEEKWVEKTVAKPDIDEVIDLMCHVADYADPLIEKEKQRQEARLKSIAAIAGL
jgi:hypothetical protein